MLQLFDRVLASHSIDTLIYLTLIAVLALMFQSVLEAVRGVVLGRTGGWIERVVGPETLELGLEGHLRGAPNAMDGLRDLGVCRSFLGSPAMMSLYDLPWVPIYMAVAFLFHPVIGWIATSGTVLLLVATLVNGWLTDARLRRANAGAIALHRQTDAVARNAEVIDSMGMVPAVLRRWQD
jgi:ATP-binding cassette subfamily C protein/ATP-binding cassette subfamily C protein EexD